MSLQAAFMTANQKERRAPSTNPGNLPGTSVFAGMIERAFGALDRVAGAMDAIIAEGEADRAFMRGYRSEAQAKYFEARETWREIGALRRADRCSRQLQELRR